MTIRILHKYKPLQRDGKNSNMLQPSHWKEEHDFEGLAEEKHHHRSTPGNVATTMGDGVNQAVFEEDGSLKFEGTATVFDDITAAVTGVKTVGVGVSLNTSEMTIDFVSSANLLDYGYLSYQLSHAWLLGTAIFPHIHWTQESANVPNFLFQYRWQMNGKPKSSAWEYLKCNSAVFPYVSGSLNQISGGATIQAPVGHSLSDIIQIRVIRDTGNNSGLFSGPDLYSGTVGITAVDIHYQIDTVGSRTEFTK